MPALTLTVLGCATPHPTPGEPCSGYLLQGDGATVWIDAGSGTYAELQHHVRVEDVDLIWVSHLHPDHSSDLLAAWNYYVNTPGAPHPVVAGPRGWASHADAFLGRPGAMNETFDVVDLDDGTVVSVRGLHLTAYRTRHGVETYAVRAEAHGGAVFAYTADTAPCPILDDVARDADLLLIEAGADSTHPGHCTPEDAAEVAKSAGARRVVLTHLAVDLTPESAVARAQPLCPAPVLVARSGATFHIDPKD